MSDELNLRARALLKRYNFDAEKALDYLEDNLSKESAPFLDELLLEGWRAKFRAYRHGTRALKEPKPKFKRGPTAGSVVQTEASKQAQKIYEEAKANYPIIYLLYGSSGISIFSSTVQDIDSAIAKYQAQVDGSMRQIHFLTDARALLVKTPKGAFRESDWPEIIALAKKYELV